MAAEVVGTAFVRIRALTTGLAKDIEDGFKKGAVDADVDDSGERLGDDFAKSAGTKIKDGIGDSIRESVDIDTINRNVNIGESGRGLGSRLGAGVRDGLDTELGDSGRGGGFRGLLSRFDGLFKRDGEKKADLFSGGFRSNLIKIALIFSPAVLGAASALLQYVVVLVGQIGFLATAAVGASAALGAMFGTVLAAGGVIALAFKTNTQALENFKEVAAEVGSAWKEVGAATQRYLLPGLERALLTSVRLVPMFRAFGTEVGRVVGNTAQLSAEWLTNERNSAKLRESLQFSVPVIESLSMVAYNLLGIFLDLFHASLPLAQQLADAFQRMTDRWQNLIGEAANSGQLAATLQLWYDRAVLVFGAFGDIFAALWDIFTIGADAVTPMFENFREFAAEFRAFTESEAGQNKLRQIFEDAREVAQAVNDLIADIARRIGAGVFEPGGNEGILAFIATLRDDVIPVLDTFIRNLSENYGDALSEFFTVFGDLLTTLSETGALKTALETLTLVLQAFTESLKILLSIPGMDKFLGVILGLSSALLVLSKLKILGLLTSLASGLASLAGAIGVAVGASAGLAAFAVGAAIIAALVGVVILLVKHWDKVKGAFEAVGRFLKDPMARLERLGEILGDIAGVIKRALLGALGAAGEALGDLGGVIGRALGRVGEELGKLPGVAARALGSFGSRLIELFAQAFTTLVSRLPGLALNLFTFWMTLPLQIVGLAANLTGLLIGLFVTAIAELVSALPGLLANVYQFFMDLPGKVIDFVTPLLADILGFFKNLFIDLLQLVGEQIANVLQFFIDLPGKVIGFITDLPGMVADTFTTLFTTAKEIISSGIEDVVGFFKDLPGKIANTATSIFNAAKDIGGKVIEGIGNGLSAIAGFASDLKDAIGRAFKSVINAFIRRVNDAIPNKLGWGPASINIPDNPIPELGAMGGIYNRPTNLIVGEAGKEVLIPLTKPSRAMQLAMQSGLFDVLGIGQQSSSMSARRISTIARPTGSGGNVYFNVDGVKIDFVGVIPSQAEAMAAGRAVVAGMRQQAQADRAFATNFRLGTAAG